MEVTVPGSGLDLGREQRSRGFSKLLPRICAPVPLFTSRLKASKRVSEIKGTLGHPSFLRHKSIVKNNYAFHKITNKYS